MNSCGMTVLARTCRWVTVPAAGTLDEPPYAGCAAAVRCLPRPVMARPAGACARPTVGAAAAVEGVVVVQLGSWMTPAASATAARPPAAPNAQVVTAGPA